MTESAVGNLGEALEALVHQFSDPWSFLRELIQNSVDAGSSEIDVRLEHDPEHGTMLVEVIDSGEGMDRTIIDTRLTRLFSSAKDGDYTKIGRFGIGFVSVFAIEPDLVCVDTGRTGEYWRVLFQADRSFERIALDMPVEGTTVRIYKRASEAEVEQARVRTREILEYWCKHARIEIRLDDELITRRMDVDGLCKIHHREEGTDLVMALTGQRNALHGYYHGGLTLHEETSDRLPHVTFKIDSRYLEHTLTRDNVIRDENFSKAMEIILREADGPLTAAMFDALAKHAAGYVGPLDRDHAALLRCATERVSGQRKRPPAFDSVPMVPRVGGPPVTLTACSDGKAVLAGQRGSLVAEHLAHHGRIVVDCQRGDAMWDLIVVATGKAPETIDRWCTVGALPAGDRLESWRVLCEAVGGQLASRGYKIREVGVGAMAYPGSTIADRVAITQERIGDLTPMSEIGELASGWLATNRALVLNADHPTVIHLRELSETEPELAAYLMIKLFFLHGELDPAEDTDMAAAASDARARRLAR